MTKHVNFDFMYETYGFLELIKKSLKFETSHFAFHAWQRVRFAVELWLALAQTDRKLLRDLLRLEYRVLICSGCKYRRTEFCVCVCFSLSFSLLCFCLGQYARSGFGKKKDAVVVVVTGSGVLHHHRHRHHHHQEERKKVSKIETCFMIPKAP